MEIIILVVLGVVAYLILFRIGVKLNRWINGSSIIAKNQERILKEMQKQNRNERNE